MVRNIGKTECHSSMFVEVVSELLDGPTTLLATVSQRGAGFIREVKDRNDVEMLEVTSANRDRLLGQIVDRIKSRD